MTATVSLVEKEFPATRAVELGRFIRQNGFVSANSFLVDTTQYKDKHKLFDLDYEKIGVMRDYPKKVSFFASLEKRRVIALIFPGERYCFKVFGSENFKEMEELANKISVHFDVGIDIYLAETGPIPEKTIEEMYKENCCVGRF